jgi:phosphatidylinositol 4-kinase B
MGCCSSCCADSPPEVEGSAQRKARWARKYQHLLQVATTARAFDNRTSDIVFRTVGQVYAHEVGASCRLAARFLLFDGFAQSDAVRGLYNCHRRSPAQMRFYAPLLVNFLLHGHGEGREQEELEMFLLGKCERCVPRGLALVWVTERLRSSLQFAHRLFWFLTSFAPETKYTSPICGAIQGGVLESTDLTRAVEAQGAIAARRLLRDGPVAGNDIEPDVSRPRKRPPKKMTLASRAQIAGRAVQEAGRAALRAVGEFVSGAREAVTGTGHETAPPEEEAQEPSLEMSPTRPLPRPPVSSAPTTKPKTSDSVPAVSVSPLLAAAHPPVALAAAAASSSRLTTTAAVVPRPLPPPGAGNGLPAKSKVLMESPMRHGGPTAEECHVFLEMIGLFAELRVVGYTLMGTDLPDRNVTLRVLLSALNDRYLPSRSGALYVPVGNTHNRLVAIHPEKSFCFRTKERVPYMVVMECLDYASRSGRPLEPGYVTIGEDHWSSSDSEDSDEWSDYEDDEDEDGRGPQMSSRVTRAIGGAVTTLRNMVNTSKVTAPPVTSRSTDHSGYAVGGGTERRGSRVEAQEGAYGRIPSNEHVVGAPVTMADVAKPAPSDSASRIRAASHDALLASNSSGASDTPLVTGMAPLSLHPPAAGHGPTPRSLARPLAKDDDDEADEKEVDEEDVDIGQWADAAPRTPLVTPAKSSRSAGARPREHSVPNPLLDIKPMSRPSDGATSIPAVYRTHRATSNADLELPVEGLLEGVRADTPPPTGKTVPRRAGGKPTPEEAAVEAELRAGMEAFEEEPSMVDIDEIGWKESKPSGSVVAASSSAASGKGIRKVENPIAASAGAEKAASHASVVAFREPWKDVTEEVRRSSPFGALPGWRLVPVIIKSHDDLRQEQFVSMLLRQFSQIWRDSNVPVWIRPYDILATSRDGGAIEAIPDTISIDSLRKGLDSGYVNLKNFYVRHWGRGSDTNERFRAARKAFVASLAGYAIVCYLLNIKDRHNGNILIDRHGHLIHIDFGFLLSNSPGGNMNFEAAPFKLTREFVELIGGYHSRPFGAFRNLCAKAFLEIRKRKEKIILLVEMMLDGNEDLPCFRAGKKAVIEQLRARFFPEATARQSVAHVNRLIDQSSDNWRTRWYDSYQKWSVGIH